MSEIQHLASSLTQLFTGKANGLFISFEAATDGLTPAQAAAVPTLRFNSVWGIVNHVWFWQEVGLRLLRGETYTPEELGAPDNSGWPTIKDATDAAAWQAARQRALEVNATLAATAARLSEAEAAEVVAAWRTPKYNVIQSVIAHNSYHTCEIISVRHMQGWWLD